jgi:hypothetical protein
MFIPKIRRTLWALTHPHSKKTYYHNPTLSPLLLVILWMVAKSCATKRMVKSPEIRGYINHLLYDLVQDFLNPQYSTVSGAVGDLSYRTASKDAHAGLARKKPDACL